MYVINVLIFMLITSIIIFIQSVEQQSHYPLDTFDVRIKVYLVYSSGVLTCNSYRLIRWETYGSLSKAIAFYRSFIASIAAYMCMM